jgi:hypothetical protein
MRKAFALLGAMCILTAACSGAGKHRVEVQELEADLAFGVTTTTTTSTTTPGSSAQPASDGADASLDELGNAFFPPLKSRFDPGSAATTPCPDAPPGAVASDAATDNVPAGVRPAAGVYRWKRSGTQKLTAFPITVAIGGFDRRLIRNVTAVDATTYTFETIRTDLYDKYFIVTTYQVKTAATQTQTVNRASVHQRAGEPDRGVSIARIEHRDRGGDLIAAPFAPVPPVLLLPLPVLDGEQFQGAGVDPLTGDSLQVQAQVIRKVTTDACGRLLDGWLVKGTKVFAGTNAHPEDFETVFATQFGATPIRERVQLTDTNATWDAIATVGQKDPTPA